MFSIEDAKTACDAQPHAVAELPFGPDALVYKVMGRMFALISLSDEPGRINLKCDPFVAQDLRDQYPAIIPGYHMNKRHWNTLILDGSLPEVMILKLIHDSYMLVVNNLSRKLKTEWESQP